MRRVLPFLLVGTLVGFGQENTPTDPGTASPCARFPGNVAPILTLQPDTAVAVGDTLHLVAIATDVDHDVIRFSALIKLRSRVDFPFPEASIDPRSGAFTFVPRSRDVPHRSVAFIADDGRCGRDTTAFVVDVREHR